MDKASRKSDKEITPHQTLEAHRTSENTGATSAQMQMQGESASIVVGGLSKTYRIRTGTIEALRDINFHVEPRQFVSLIGPSGCGKTTILRILAGLINDYSGTVAIEGKIPQPGRTDVAFMPQKAVLFPWRSIIDNIMLPIEIFGMDKSVGHQRARQLLNTVALDGYENARPYELSGGMQQRVNLARSLVHDAPILFMDEPFAALDEFTRERLIQEVASLHHTSGKTFVYITHNIAEAVFLSDKVVMLATHPGSVMRVETIPFQHPRSLDIMGTTEFNDIVANLRGLLDPQVETE